MNEDSRHLKQGIGSNGDAYSDTDTHKKGMGNGSIMVRRTTSHTPKY